MPLGMLWPLLSIPRILSFLSLPPLSLRVFVLYVNTSSLFKAAFARQHYFLIESFRLA